MAVTKDTNPSDMVSAPEAPNTSTPESPSTNLDVGELLEARATNDGETFSDGEAKSDGGADIAGQVVVGLPNTVSLDAAVVAHQVLTC